ncbi:hypothetical protein Tco_0513776 [Tanacetum coccineum]
MKSSATTTTIPPPPPFFYPPSQQGTPTTSPTTEATTSLPDLLDFASVFRFNERVSSLEKDVSQFKQDDKSAKLLDQIKSRIPAIVDDHLTTRIGYVVQTAFQSYTAEFEKEAKAEHDRFIDIIDKSSKDFTQEEIKSQLPTILPDFVTPMIQSTVAESFENKILLDTMQHSKSYQGAPKHRDLYDNAEKTKTRKKTPPLDKNEGRKEGNQEPTHTVDDSGAQQNQEFDTGNNDDQPAVEAASRDTWFKQPERPPTPDPEWNKSKHLNITNLTQKILVGPAFNLLKGTCKSRTKLEYHFKECFKTTTDRLDWNNPEGQEYPFDLSKPLPLVEDYRGRQVVPVNYFINNDLKYLKGGSSSRTYTTSTIKTKAANYDISWIEDMVPSLWSPAKVSYDKFAVWGVSH